jgi:hypothetical protein
MEFSTQSIEMAKAEGDIYEAIASRWFEKSGFQILEYHGAKGIDFIVQKEDRVYGYEVKGHELITIVRIPYRQKLIDAYRITGIKIANLNLEHLTNFLIVIYDNFTDLFRIWDIPKDEMYEYLGADRGYLSFFKFFTRKGILASILDVKPTERTLKIGIQLKKA